MNPEWRQAFRRWAESFFGRARYQDKGVDPDWLAAYKAGFRGGWRAGQREATSTRVDAEAPGVRRMDG